MGPVILCMGWLVLSPRTMICCQPFRMAMFWRKPMLKITLQLVGWSPTLAHKIFSLWVIPANSTSQILFRTSAQKHKIEEQEAHDCSELLMKKTSCDYICSDYCSALEKWKKDWARNFPSYLQYFLMSLVSRGCNSSQIITSWISPLWRHYNTNRPKQTKALAQDILLPYLIKYYNNVN